MLKKILLITFISVFSFANNFELSGTIISDNEKVITSRYMGYVTGVYASEGSFVKKGSILYEIDSSTLDSKKQEALLTLQIQKNHYNNVLINYNRYKRLFKQDLVSKYDVEQLELNLRNIENMIAIAQAKLKEVETLYDYLKVKAPNDGLIIKKTIKVGEMAMPSVPAIILSDLTSLEIKTDIPESNLNDIKLGQEVDVYISSIDLKTKGKIKAIIPNVNSTTHSFILKISFENKDKKIYPGMYAKININMKN
ncbi:MAG: Cobalt-zinc-cadmium resistance protein CzcB [Arcobacter lacus]|nr:MAG: Cobalt-zinc-cadmium resistance protein CzcB [Arcobacter lacus]